MCFSGPATRSRKRVIVDSKLRLGCPDDEFALTITLFSNSIYSHGATSPRQMLGHSDTVASEVQKTYGGYLLVMLSDTLCDPVPGLSECDLWLQSLDARMTAFHLCRALHLHQIPTKSRDGFHESHLARGPILAGSPNQVALNSQLEFCSPPLVMRRSTFHHSS